MLTEGVLNPSNCRAGIRWLTRRPDLHERSDIEGAGAPWMTYQEKEEQGREERIEKKRGDI